MRLQRLLPVTLALALVPALAPVARAQGRYRRPMFEHAYEFSFLPSFNTFQGKEEIDDDFGFGARFGYLYTPNHEIEFLVNDVSTNDTVFTTDSVDITDFQVAYIYNFTKRDVVPYLTIGLGLMHIDDRDLGTETDAEVGFGGGVRFFLGRAVYARFELRRNSFEGDGRVFADGEAFHHDQFAFGVGWRIGAP